MHALEYQACMTRHNQACMIRHAGPTWNKSCHSPLFCNRNGNVSGWGIKYKSMENGGSCGNEWWCDVEAKRATWNHRQLHAKQGTDSLAWEHSHCNLEMHLK